MADWLAARVRASPDATALVDRRSGERLSYAELDAQATRRAGALRSFDIGAGDHVASALGVGVASVAFVHAVSRLGAVLVPLSGRLTGSELDTRVQRADCDLLVCDENSRTAARAVDSTKVVSIDAVDGLEYESVGRTHGESNEVGAENGASEAGNDHLATARNGAGGPDGAGTWLGRGVEGGLDDPLVILFTSGTTGRPKGVVLTAGNVLASAGASAARLGVLPGDRWLLTLSPGGMGGLAPIYRSVLYGTALVPQGTFEPGEVLETLSAAECTGVSLVPTMLGRMLDALEASGEKRGEEENRDDGGSEGSKRGERKEGSGSNGRFPAGVRCVLLGGAPASESLIERCRERGVPVYPTYGMTETASQVATARPAEAFFHPGTVGRPLMGVDIVAVEGDEELEADERGELVVRGPVVTPGYYGDAESSGEAFSERGFHTGDIGYVDSEGRVFVTGRLDDRIVTGGQTVDPEEVRTTLRAHPAVRDAAVVGLESEEWGERVGALVVACEAGGASEEAEAVSATDLDAHCRASLAGYKLPRTVAFADALPRTESGTIDRVAVATELRDAAEN